MNLQFWDAFNLCCSVAQSCPTLCNLMDCSTPGFPVLYHFPELAQTHVHQVSDAIEPSHPLSPSPPALSLSQHQGLFWWVCSSYQVATVLELQFQHHSFQWIFRTDFLELWLVWSPFCPRDSRIFFSTTVQKHQFLSAQPFLLSNSHPYMTTRKNHSFDYTDLCRQSNVSAF